MVGVDATEMGFFRAGGRRAPPELSVNFGSAGAWTAATAGAFAGSGSAVASGAASGTGAPVLSVATGTGVDSGVVLSALAARPAGLRDASAFFAAASGTESMAAISVALITSPSN